METNHDRNRPAAADSRGYALSGKVMLVSTVVLFSAVLFLLFLHLYLRSRFLLRRRRARRLRRGLSFASEGPGGDRPQSNSSAAADRRGLDPAVLKSLPVLVFAAAEEEPAECAVCLSEFEEGEKMRGLPRCGHRFHIECVDMWFHSHATCPLCRSAVETADAGAAHRVAATPEPSAPDPEQPAPAEDGVEAPASSSAGREVRVEVSGRGWDGELGMGLKLPGSRMLLLTRLLSKDSRSCRAGGGATAEPDLERGEGAADGPPAAAQ